MTDPDVRGLLDAALQDEPPNTLDPARLMKTGKRRLRLQRASAALGVVAVAGGVALGTTLLKHDPDAPAPGHVTAAAPTATTSAPPSTPVVIASDVIAAQNAALRQEYTALGSGMTTVSGRLVFVATQPSGLVGVDYTGSRMATRLGDKHGTGGFTLSADPTTGADTSTIATCDATKLSCAVETIGGISVTVETDHPTPKTTRIFTVALSLSGNVLVNGTSDNLDSPQTRDATRPAPPLTADQLARITAAIARVSP